MHSVRALTRSSRLHITRSSSSSTMQTRSAQPSRLAMTMAMAIRQQSTQAVLPKNLQPGPAYLENKIVSTTLGDLDLTSPPANVRAELWALFVTTLPRLAPKSTKVPKKSVLHWILLNAQTREELDMALKLTVEWRMTMHPITQATTQIWAEACIRLEYPEIFVNMLMDRWKYRQLPISYNMAKFIKFLGTQSAAEADVARSEQLLDDAFRIFALYPYYGLKHDAAAYGALVEACCEVNSEEAWRRALVASEETLASETPAITLEALKALEIHSAERREPEMAERYRSLAARLDLKPAAKKDVSFDQNGNLIA
ncbi:hypothetical protein BX661DRAFT_185214 [Kickxella alabastrina]|uniref:uncharacterized protein n=1 Tax=Kickxella alabastrina TaxID=61397 RepID=UPI00221FC345|nr:uncharacterized protein BX661DRAFT_185214 [Kickxella alabastrina]KAI7825073.1 hypothetical protein BX661DRAFT_185214 [Kickxella alabastrina]